MTILDTAMDHMSETAKHVLDVLSICTAIGTLILAWLPPLAALASLIWTMLRIYEMFTGKKISDLTGSRKQE